MADFGNTLRSATRISISDTAQTRSNTIGGTDTSDILTFTLSSRRRLTLSLNRSRADLELIQDKNGNNRIDAGEVLASSRATGLREERIQLNRVSSGKYFLRVLPGSSGESSYKLTTRADAARDMSKGEQIWDLVNRRRTSRGLPALALNTQLNSSAQLHSNNMAEQDFFSHTDHLGRSSRDRIIAANYAPMWSGENIAAGNATASATIDQWMNSSGHRANILNVNYTEIGVGVRSLSNDTGTTNWNHYWTQNFASY